MKDGSNLVEISAGNLNGLNEIWIRDLREILHKSINQLSEPLGLI